MRVAIARRVAYCMANKANPANLEAGLKELNKVLKDAEGVDNKELKSIEDLFKATRAIRIEPINWGSLTDYERAMVATATSL